MNTNMVISDASHLPRIRQALKDIRLVCNLRGIDCPVNYLVPEDGMLDAMPADMLENAIVLCAWPGADIRVGGPEGKVLTRQRKIKGVDTKVLLFHNREHTIKVAMEAVEGAIKAMREGKSNGQPT